MAISIDTVYQRVLAIANKEQRGYVTPQEFNLMANQAQMSIFESYFYDKNARDRVDPEANKPGWAEVEDVSELISKKLGASLHVQDTYVLLLSLTPPPVPNIVYPEEVNPLTTPVDVCSPLVL